MRFLFLSRGTKNHDKPLFLMVYRKVNRIFHGRVCDMDKFLQENVSKASNSILSEKFESESECTPKPLRELYKRGKKLIQAYLVLNQSSLPSHVIQEQLHQDINRVILNEKNQYEKVTTSHVEKSGQQVDLDFTHNRLIRIRSQKGTLSAQ
uniref:Uncharacterized protein n=1 Tax=Photobacterium damsela subsp. piscicida TaxID=38294 RepID=Q2VL28_PHODP|nr:hypothetical protein [Photobacterium damselae]ABA00999.1 hypothetical protein [Photobacterium damselae subsp. piscicida]